MYWFSKATNSDQPGASRDHFFKITSAEADVHIGVKNATRASTSESANFDAREDVEVSRRPVAEHGQCGGDTCKARPVDTDDDDRGVRTGSANELRSFPTDGTNFRESRHDGIRVRRGNSWALFDVRLFSHKHIQSIELQVQPKIDGSDYRQGSDKFARASGREHVTGRVP